MKLKELRNSLMTKALTVLGFGSPLALMACYGTPVDDYPTETYIQENELNGQKGDSTKLTVVAEGRWQVVAVPDFATVSQNSGEGTAWITVRTLDDNRTDRLREGTIVIKDESGTFAVPIAQLPQAGPVEE